jgi:isopenicillin-N N-acyltransferase-like protein
MSLPILHLRGTPLEQGLEHGRQLRERIARNLRVYFDRFEQEARLPRDEVVTRAQAYRQAIETKSPAYFAGMQGIADGSGVGLDEVVMLNVRYEIHYYQMGRNALLDGCTSFAVLPDATADGHLLMGQNWDWIPEVQGAIVHTIEPDGLQTLAFTEAGILGGKIGLNSAGLGMCINGLSSTDDDWSRLSKPFHVRCYEALRASEPDAAAKVATEGRRSCSANFLLAQAPGKAIDIETAPERARLIRPDNSRLVHANHFLDPGLLGVVEPPNERRPHSYLRQVRMTELLGSKAKLTIADIETFLRDHDDSPYSICRHRDETLPASEHYATVTSVVIDLTSKTMAWTDGPPCTNHYSRLSLV